MECLNHITRGLMSFNLEIDAYRALGILSWAC